MQDHSLHLSDLRQHGERVRKALQEMAAEGRWPALRGFPANGIDTAVLLLGAFLADRGCTAPECVRGERGHKRDDDWQGHVWLRTGPVVIDIAADRFADAPAPVLVAAPSEWHAATFRIAQAGEPADFRRYTGPALLHVMFAQLLQRIAI